MGMPPTLVLMMLLAQQPEALSLLNAPLYAPSIHGDVRARADRDLADATAVLARTPKDVDAILREAAALRTLGRLGEALEALTRAIEVVPDDRLYRERGRDYIVYRKFAVAVRDLRQARTTIPAAACDIGLAEYLDGLFAESKAAYADCQTPDAFAGLAAQRAAQPAAVPQTASADALTRAYVATLDPLVRGNRVEADKKLKQLVEKQRGSWTEPAYIAAEAEYARLLKAEGKKPGSDHKKKKKR